MTGKFYFPVINCKFNNNFYVKIINLKIDITINKYLKY